jgi:Citrate transporter
MPAGFPSPAWWWPLALVVAAVPFVLPSEDVPAHKLAAAVIFVASYLALAVGKIPGLSIDRAGVALVGACLMVASGVLSLADAYKAIDSDTITLLLGMMIIVANLRLSGFFAMITNWVMQHMHRPLTLLAAVTVVSGVASAFLVNDATCLILAPLVLDLVLSLKRNPLPYLLAVAMASNAGSVATNTGNPHAGGEFHRGGVGRQFDRRGESRRARRRYQRLGVFQGRGTAHDRHLDAWNTVAVAMS